MKNCKYYLQNLCGWRTKKKILVFQSDDWGSIRMPSRKIAEALHKHDQILANSPYTRYDTLASSTDLIALFETLSSVRDSKGRPAVLTANCLVTNPDFERIEKNNFDSYFYEEIDKTFARYGQENALKLWKQGEDSNLFKPQFHGREHVNVPLWLFYLKQKHPGVLEAFKMGVYGVGFRNIHTQKKNFQAAWQFNLREQEDFINNIIKEGFKIFENRFGYKSKTAIAPAYIWSSTQEKLLQQLGVQAMQGIPFQYVPEVGNEKLRKKIRVTQSANNSMVYLQRNVFFEPSLLPTSKNEVLHRIKIAFEMRKPAIIGCHRINFIGGLNEDNRNSNLLLLRQLLKSIVYMWPDVEFMCSATLLEEMKSERD